MADQDHCIHLLPDISHQFNTRVQFPRDDLSLLCAEACETVLNGRILAILTGLASIGSASGFVSRAMLRSVRGRVNLQRIA